MTTIAEADVEQAALAWLADLGWRVAHGPDIAPDTPGAERDGYEQVVLARRLRDALAQLNPDLPTDALDDAFRRLTRPAGPTLAARNRALHRMLVEGVPVEYRSGDGAIRGAQAWAINVEKPAANDWLAVNQFTVTEQKHTRRPDVVLFVNGLPLGLIELKNPADEDATIWTAWQQLRTYQAELPALFAMNALLLISDGIEARLGTLTAGQEWFKPWRTITGEGLADPELTELQVLLAGVCAPARLLALVRDFTVFEDDGSGTLAKKVAGYHQFHAVRIAVAETLRAAELQRTARQTAEVLDGRYEAGRRPGGAPGDRRIGVVWPYARLRQEPDDGLLRRVYRPRAGPGEPDHRRAHRPQRSGRPALRHLLPLPGPLAPAARAGGEPGRPAPQAGGAGRWCGLHNHSEVLPRGARRHPPDLSRRGATSWSSRTRRTAASTTS